MTDTPDGPLIPQQARKPVSQGRIVLMLALGGPALAAGGCALFLSNLNLQGGSRASDNLSALGALGFVVGGVTFLVGIIWALVRLISRRSAGAGR